MTPQEALRAVLDLANRIEALAFEMKAPNAYTPQFVMLANEVRALRAALAQPEQEIEPDRPHVEDDGCPTEKAVLQRFWREHHAQPKREPVAWMYDWYDETEDIDGVPIGGIVSDCISKDYDEAHSPTMGCHNIRPLYTAPPQREWQGLTDEEINYAWRVGEANVGWDHFEMVAREIEAKLREKNT